MKKFIFVLVMLMISSFAYAEDKEIFGLKWNMSVKEVVEAGVKLSPLNKDDGVEFVYTDKLPKNLSDAFKYLLVFGNDKLIKIAALIGPFKNDPTGSESKERFEQLEKIISGLGYIKDKSIKVQNQYVYRNTNEFYKCLEYPGCGCWATIYNGEDRRVLIQIKGTDDFDGIIQITFESVPYFKNFLEEQEKINSEKDKDAM